MGLADTASEYKDHEFEKILLNEGLRVSQKDDNLAEHSLYFQQSLGDLATFGERQWGYSPGRFPHPPSQEWRMDRLGDNFYEPKA